MPELPEVETVVKTLEARLLGEVIVHVEVYYDKMVKGLSVDEFKKQLMNQRIEFFRRYGKYMVIGLTNYSLIVHLRMEGKFFIKPKDEVLLNHEHIVFTLASGNSLRYHDVRKFGTFALIPSTDEQEILRHPSLAKLAKDANLEWTEDELYQKLKNKKIAIKTALLDQTVIAGLGNIYVNEALFLAKVHPEQRTDTITPFEASRITRASKEVLNQSIALGGTTIRSYTSSLGVTGRFQQKLNVHGREKQPCIICATPIKKIKVGGRGTYYCPTCQKLRPFLVGITGGIAMGKSIVSGELRCLGYQVIDSDEIVRNLHELPDVKKQVQSLLPEVIKDGMLDRKLLAKIIFKDSHKKAKLEDILHPLVKLEMEKQIAESQARIIFLDIPLLFEAKMETFCDATIVVYTSYETNIARLMERDAIDEEYAKLKINNQMSITEKMKKATYLIDNNGTKEETIQQVHTILKKIRMIP